MPKQENLMCGYLSAIPSAYTRVGVWPLSISTDRIGVPAMRWAAAISAAQPRLALGGLGGVVEAYPAAALKRWGLRWNGYKGREPKQRAERHALVPSLLDKARDWLSMAEDDQTKCEGFDDAFNPLTAALVARADGPQLAHFRSGSCDDVPRICYAL